MILADKVNKERKSDRILVLKVIDGEQPKSSTGLIDNRLFTGENKLHAIMHPRSRLWYFKYDNGRLPEPLKGQFTTFPLLIQHANRYFSQRNVEITDVLD